MRRVMIIRGALVRLHRWTGLFMAGFLIIAGLTGTLLAFNSELEHVFAPRLFATRQPEAQALDLATLLERAEPIALPQGRVTGVLRTEEDQVQVYVTPNRNPVTGTRFELDYTQLFVNPWTGAELGRRRRGDLSEGLINLMPFIYAVHWTLGAGGVGQWIMGIVALIWTGDSFNGFYLTLPFSKKRFWRRWKVAWSIKAKASSFRLGFDLHRASGLWLWVMFFIFAWSSVMMNIRPTYERAMSILFEYESPRSRLASTGNQPNEHPRIGWREALGTGQRLMAEQAASHGLTVIQPLGLTYNSTVALYSYEVRGSRDVFERAPKGGSTVVMFDGDTGEFRKFSSPTGMRTGNTIESWLYALHMARVFGRPYQILVAVIGLITGILSVSGVYIWWRKRRIRILNRARQASHRPPALSANNV